ncbi:MAG: hypothetical protein WC294_06480 [Methanoregula sp.]|jgi:hypothetical protein
MESVNSTIPETSTASTEVLNTSSEIPQEPQWLTTAKRFEQARIDGKIEKKKLAIVGFAPTRDLAPYADPTWEIWTLNDMRPARETRHFDIHTVDNIETDVVAGRTSNAARKTNIPEQALDNMGISGLSKLQCPVYMQDVNGGVPCSIKFPLEEMLLTFKSRNLTGARYFTNSISYMIAYAIYEGLVIGHQWDEIQIFGVDMAVGDEYIAQRPSCEYWIGIAEGMGVKMYIPDASDLNKTAFLYAWEEKAQKAFENKMRKIADDARIRMNALSQQRAEIDRLIHHAEAQIGTVSDLSRVWSNGDSKFIH